MDGGHGGGVLLFGGAEYVKTKPMDLRTLRGVVKEVSRRNSLGQRVPREPACKHHRHSVRVNDVSSCHRIPERRILRGKRDSLAIRRKNYARQAGGISLRCQAVVQHYSCQLFSTNGCSEKSADSYDGERVAI